ncbi:hypothetical protein FOL47_002500 [Perkinsus chesapeaki]|uniref:WRKY19-like zinc finger domain-containing protein n=1 Tax=Perkinsus chesapeaki TaxID=330153 RepID=A0A7J6N2V1_PERCH|nr:hypothetical protein FOL47_002500 [Perkinsus chesapeaki]
MVVKPTVQDSTDLKRVRKAPTAAAAPKVCKTDGCDRQVRNGASYCITHGGGNTCQQTGCSTSARHGSVYCIAHGGGRRCQEPGCTKSAVGSTDFCKAHGGACERSAAARSDYCSEHRYLDGDAPAEKKRVTQKGHNKAGGTEKDGRDSYLVARDSTRPSFTATDITVAPLNYFLKDFRNAEDLGPPLLFTIGENTRVPSPCDTPQEVHEESEPEEEEEDVPMYTHPLARFMYNGI